jgi:hypothetical protein
MRSNSARREMKKLPLRSKRLFRRKLRRRRDKPSKSLRPPKPRKRKSSKRLGVSLIEQRLDSQLLNRVKL